MADVFCPACGKLNPAELESCQFCGARLKTIISSTPVDTTPIQAGEDPVKKSTSEFEKITPTKGDPVHAGEAPVKIDTASLESTLPSWLRSLREDKEAGEGESPAEGSSDQDLSLKPAPPAASDSVTVQTDWLFGLGKAGSEDLEEIPDWLTDLKTEKPETDTSDTSDTPETSEAPRPALKLTGSLSPGMTDNDWAARLGGIPPQSETPESAQEGDQPGEEETPNFFNPLKSEPALPVTPILPPDPQDESLQDWLADTDILGEIKPAYVHEEATPDWLNQLKEENPDFQSAPSEEEEIAAGTPVPDWLSSLGAVTTSPPEQVAGEILPDWMSGQEAATAQEFIAPEQEAAIPPEPAAPLEATGENLPEWLSGMEAKSGSQSAVPAASAGENLPDWLSGQEPGIGVEYTAPVTMPSSEPAPASAARDDIPNWLSKFQADVDAAAVQEAKKEQFEQAPPAKKEGTGPLPEWLAGIKRSDAPSSGVPALISNEEESGTEEKGGAAFAMELPDWLSKLNPDQAPEKTQEGTGEPSTTENLDVSQLPSWVQAMRPVESVVDDTKPLGAVDAQVTEQSGPLAGLLGVLPSTPGLGVLRRPPPYSALLQVTEGQKRYASSFEQLISNETKPKIARRPRLASNRIWRWVITIFLIGAVGLPLIFKLPVTQASNLAPTELVSAFTEIGGLQPGAPVLVVFDYEPALSGELEAAAAPLMDQLLFRNPRLALISTNPTGPVLAERFLHNAGSSPLVAGHNYQTGQQYVNLGYLAGGSSGVQYFAISPSAAAPNSMDGKPAWGLPPLQGLQALSDFAAIIVLTDNADSGRIWIEQTGSKIGNTPMLMVISAQAEPMILPYYESGQIKGLVTGLAGGEASEQKFVRPDAQTGLAQKYRDSFSAGTLVAEILIVVGALWSAITGWRARRDKSGKKV